MVSQCATQRMHRARKRLLTDAIACCLFSAAVAHASTITVTNNADSGAGSLRDAIASAVAGDEIVFDPAGLSGGQTIALTSGALTPNVNMVITGAGAPAVTISNATSRAFDFTSSAISAVTLDSLTIGGTASDNYTGGAIHVSTIGTTFALTLTNDTVRGTLANATRGGAISITGLQDSLSVDLCDIAGTVSAINAVSNNDAGGIYFASNGTLTLQNSVVSGQVSGSTSGKNFGGAIYQNSGTSTITNSTIAGASVVGAKGVGGGLALNGGTLNLSNVTISGNSADFAGGGIYVFHGTLNALNTTISGNTAGTRGGGVVDMFYATNGRNGTTATSLTNTTISGNTAPSASALYVGYVLPQFHSTPSTNTITLTNTIVSGTVARQTSGSATDTNEKLNAGNSVFDDAPTTGAGNTINGTNTGNFFATDPLLGPLQDNGGATATMALTMGSPAIDTALAAACPSLDQRGFPRLGGCDIGAFEYQGDRIFANSFEDGETYR